MPAAKPGPPPDPAPVRGDLTPPAGLTAKQLALWHELVLSPWVTSKDRELLLDAMEMALIKENALVAGDNTLTFRASDQILKIRRALRASPQARANAGGNVGKPAIDASRDDEDDDIEID